MAEKTYRIKVESNFKQLKADINQVSAEVARIVTQFKTLSSTAHTVNVKTRTKPDPLSKQILNKELDNKVLKLTMTVLGGTSVKSLGTTLKIVVGTVKGFGIAIKNTTNYLSKMTAQLRITEKGVNFLVRSQNSPIGTALAYGVTAAVDEFINLEHQLNRVRAIASESGDSYVKLKDHVLELAQSTSLTARELGKGAEMFALAGFKVDEIIGILPELTALVINSGESMRDIASVTAASIRTWGTHISTLTSTSDRLTSGMSNAKVTISELGNGMSKAAPMFKETGQGISQLVATLQVMSDRGIAASRAGTGLKTIMTKLAKTTPEAKQRLASLNVSVVEGISGQTQMSEVVETLNNKIRLSGRTVTELNNAFTEYVKTGKLSANTTETVRDMLAQLGIKAYTSYGRLKSFNSLMFETQNVATKLVGVQEKVNESLDRTGGISKEVQTALGKLGIKFGTVNGHVRKMNEIAKDLYVAFQSLTDTERLAAAKEIVGLHHAEKFLQIIAGSKEVRQEMNVLGQKIMFVGSEMELQTYRNDLAAKSGRQFAEVFKEMGGYVQNLRIPINDFNIALDNNNKQIMAANGSVISFLETITAFKGAGIGWSESIKIATEISKDFNQQTNSLTVGLVALGQDIKFDTTLDGLQALKQQMDVRGEQAVFDILSQTVGVGLAKSFTEAAKNAYGFTDTAKKSLSEVIGKASEMRSEIEGTTKHTFDRLVSAWQAAGTLIAEAINPVTTRLFEIGIVAAQVMGEMLPPLLKSMLSWLDNLKIDVDTTRVFFKNFFDGIANGARTAADFILMVSTTFSESGITFENVGKFIKASFTALIETIKGVGEIMNWFGIISDETMDNIRTSVENMSSKSSVAMNNVAATTEASMGRTAIAMDNKTREAALSAALNVFGFSDDVSHSMHSVTDVTTKQMEIMSRDVTSGYRTMRTQAGQEMQSLATESATGMRNVGSAMNLATNNIQIQTVNHFRSMTSQIMDMIRNLYDSVTGYLSGMISSIVASVKQAYASVTSYFGGNVTVPTESDSTTAVQSTAATDTQLLEETRRTNSLLSNMQSTPLASPVY